MNFESPPNKYMALESPSRFLNLNSHISSFRAWSESFKAEKNNKGNNKGPHSTIQVKPFQTNLEGLNTKIEEEFDICLKNKFFLGMSSEELKSFLNFDKENTF